MNVGLMGFGYWGPNIVRNLLKIKDVNIVAICDISESGRDKAKNLFPEIKTTAIPEDVLQAKDIEAIFVITPPSTHYDIARAALEHHKHVFIEKPMALNSADINDLLQFAACQRLQIAVDHTFIYSGAVRAMRSFSLNLGKITHIHSERSNMGIFQKDVDVMWDLACHDFSILNSCFPSPSHISAFATDSLGLGSFDTADILLHYHEGFKAHIYVSWISATKNRKMTITGQDGSLIYDDLAHNKLLYLENGVKKTHQGIEFPTNEVFVPFLESTEPLEQELRAFINWIKNPSNVYMATGAHGAKVVKMLEAASFSANNSGLKVKLL